MHDLAILKQLNQKTTKTGMDNLMKGLETDARNREEAEANKERRAAAETLRLQAVTLLTELYKSQDLFNTVGGGLREARRDAAMGKAKVWLREQGEIQ